MLLFSQCEASQVLRRSSRATRGSWMQSRVGSRSNWSTENLERVRQTIVKKFNAEIHSQAAIEGMLALKHEHSFTASDVRR